MIQVGSFVQVADNSGTKTVKCFRLWSQKTGMGGSARLGDVIRGSVRRHTPHRKVQKGELVRVLLVQIRKKRGRGDGSHVRYGRNVGVTLKGTSGSLPLGTRIRSRMGRQFRKKPLRT